MTTQNGIWFKKSTPPLIILQPQKLTKSNTFQKGWKSKNSLRAKYIVFSFRAQSKDSLQPVADYIYKEWFSQSSCRLNEDVRYDFAKYREKADADGKSMIEYWVPILLINHFALNKI